MFSTPSKLGQPGRDPPTHLIVNQGGSSSDEGEQRKREQRSAFTLSPVGSLPDDDFSDSADPSLRVPVLEFGGSTTETQLEMQTLVVNAFHKVLSVLRQYVLLSISLGREYSCPYS